MPEHIYIPPPFDRTDDEDIQRYYDAIVISRNLAMADPLKSNMVLSLKLHLKANTSPTSRTLPWFSKKEGAYTCQLLESLQEGPDRYSQVWIALVKPTHDTSVSEEAKIVLKIFQPSLSFIPDPEYDWSGEYANPEALAKNEDQVYTVLTDMQGTYIPYYYGMQEVRFYPTYHIP